MFPKLARLREQLRGTPDVLSASQLLLQRMTASAGDLAAAVESRPGGEVAWWARAFENQCRFALEELNHLAPWLDLPTPADSMWRLGSAGQVRRLGELRRLVRQLDEVPALADVARLELTLLPAIEAVLAGAASEGEAPLPPEIRDWLERLRAALVQAAERAADRLAELRKLAARCAELADIDYDFLYDRDRHLLAIGYNVDEHRLDASFYDLLASEARLASFVAIAQGKLPQEHWFAPRPAADHRRRPARRCSRGAGRCSST